MKLVLATHNKGKIREFQKVFSEIGWEAVPVADVSDAPDPEETGKTFKENALQKAHYYAKVTNLPVLSDDSGIIADVLGDRPGVYSARYAGKHGDDEANNRKLVEALKPYTGDDRKGHYVCVIALVYDPLFYLPQYGKTMAEISMEEKNKISHRGKAIQALLNELKKL